MPEFSRDIYPLVAQITYHLATYLLSHIICDIKINILVGLESINMYCLHILNAAQVNHPVKTLLQPPFFPLGIVVNIIHRLTVENTRTYEISIRVTANESILHIIMP